MVTILLISLKALASSKPGTDTLTISAPAACNSFIWFTVDRTSEVLVLVID